MNLTRERPFTIIVVNGRLFALTRKEVIMKSIGNEFWGMNEEEINRVTAKYPGYSIGRILSQKRDCYRLITGKGEALARVSGKFRYSVESISDYPAVGDYVLVDHIDDIHDNEFAVIHVVLARKSVFLRKAAGTSRTEQVVAANIDTVFLCMALNKDYNLRRLERYLSIAWESGATPVVVLTKTDLCDDLEIKRMEVETIAIGVDILETTAMETDGIQSILPYLQKGKTVAFIGSSGVGKSTLINRLMGGDILATDGLRNDDKGHHTTTHRELLLLPDGAMVIDTPGMRELGMWDTAEGIDRAFAEIEELASQCRFHDCSHTSEPGCAVCKALENGTLSKERYLSYKKLKTENAFLEDSENYLATKEKKFKAIAKQNKRNRKK